MGPASQALRQLSRQQDEVLRHQLDDELDSIRDLLFTADPSTLIPIEASTLSSSLPTASHSAQALQTTFNTAEPAPAPSASTLEGRDAAFDQYVRELAFDKRARPKDRTKTEEELAIEEKERLEKAERRRLRRMEGEDDFDSEEEAESARQRRKQLRGGDDLEDDFQEEPSTLGMGLSDTAVGKEERADDAVNGSESDEGQDSEKADEDGSGDMESEAGSDDGSFDDEEGTGKLNQHEALVQAGDFHASPTNKKQHAGKEVPFTFPCPGTHEHFLEILEDLDEADVTTVVQRIRTLHHPSLAEENKFKLQASLNFFDRTAC
jgi:nucleolar protein 14